MVSLMFHVVPDCVLDVLDGILDSSVGYHDNLDGCLDIPDSVPDVY